MEKDLKRQRERERERGERERGSRLMQVFPENVFEREATRATRCRLSDATYRDIKGYARDIESRRSL